MWVLLIIWTGNFVATAQMIQFESQELCEKARTEVQAAWSPISQRSELKIQTVCLKVEK